MTIRYSKIYSLDENLYVAGAPVLILAGALLKDNKLQKIIAQLKFKNIQDKNIKAVVIVLTTYDAAHQILTKEEYQYLDLDVPRDGSFGQQVPLVINDKMTRSFSVSVAKVVFRDDSIWTHEIAEWKSLQGPTSIRQYFETDDLVDQYHIRFGKICDYIFSEEEDLWYCTCGEINHMGELICHRCQRPFDELSSINLEELKENLANEQKDAVLHSHGIKKYLKHKKLVAIGGAVIILLCLALAYSTDYSDNTYDDSSYEYGAYGTDRYMDDDFYEQIAANALYSEILQKYSDADAGSSKYSVNKVEHLGDTTYVYGSVYLYDKYGELTGGYSDGSGSFSKTFEVTISNDGDDITCDIR